MIFSFIHLIRFCVDDARVFQRVSMNVNMTIGQAACWLLCQYTQNTLTAFAESYRVLRVNQVKELVAVCAWYALSQSLRLYYRKELCVSLAAVYPTIKI